MIELLVVISIIAILAVLLLPVIGMAQSAARRATCRGNLKNMQSALELYATQFASFYVPGKTRDAVTGATQPNTVPCRSGSAMVSWRVLLTSYIGGEPNPFKNFANCNLVRSDPKYGGKPLGLGFGRGFVKVFTDSTPGGYNGYYFGNAWIFDAHQDQQGSWWNVNCNKGQIAHPGSFPVVAPSNQEGMTGDYLRTRYIRQNGNLEYVDFRHDAKANILYLDGHVDTYDEDSAELATLAKQWNTWVFQTGTNW